MENFRGNLELKRLDLARPLTGLTVCDDDDRVRNGDRSVVDGADGCS